MTLFTTIALVPPRGHSKFRAGVRKRGIDAVYESHLPADAGADAGAGTASFRLRVNSSVALASWSSAGTTVDADADGLTPLSTAHTYGMMSAKRARLTGSTAIAFDGDQDCVVSTPGTDSGTDDADTDAHKFYIMPRAAAVPARATAPTLAATALPPTWGPQVGLVWGQGATSFDGSLPVGAGSIAGPGLLETPLCGAGFALPLRSPTATGTIDFIELLRTPDPPLGFPLAAFPGGSAAAAAAMAAVVSPLSEAPAPSPRPEMDPAPSPQPEMDPVRASVAKSIKKKPIKKKPFGQLTKDEFQAAVEVAVRGAYGRLEQLDPHEALTVMGRTLAGADRDDQGVGQRPCYCVHRKNMVSRSPFQTKIGERRLVAQKAIFAAYHDLAPEEIGTWQVQQECLQNDRDWWCFEPTHLLKCKNDHVMAGITRNKIPAAPNAYFLAKTRRVIKKTKKEIEPEEAAAAALAAAAVSQPNCPSKPTATETT